MSNSFDPATYRMTVGGKERMQIRPMLFRVDPPPFTDESLLGLVARSAARNGFDRLSKVGRLADYQSRDAYTLLRIDPLVAARLAFVMKVGTSEIVARLQPVIDYADASGEFIDFYGAPVRAVFCERVRRRTSPRALRIAPYHRALHDLRPFSFCTETLEMLIDECPACHAPLDWVRTRGIVFCGRCVDEDDAPTVDLRDYPQPLVDVDPGQVRVVSGLIHPDPGIRQQAFRRVDPKLRDQSPGDLFGLAMMLGLSLRTGPKGIGLKRGGAGLFTPDLLAMVGRAMLDWSKGFGEIADHMRGSAEQRKQLLGIQKEIGALAHLRTTPFLPQSIRTIVAQATDDDMKRTALTTTSARKKRYRYRDDLIDIQTAASMLNVRTKALVRSVRGGIIEGSRIPGPRQAYLIPKAAIEAVKVVHDDMVEGTRAARNVGLPLAALEAVAAAGRISRATGPAVSLYRASIHYRTGSLTAYTDRLLRRRRRVRTPPGSMLFDAAIRRLPPGDKPWLEILDAIENGALPIYATNRSGPPFASVVVDPEVLAEIVRPLPPTRHRTPAWRSPTGRPPRSWALPS